MINFSSNNLKFNSMSLDMSEFYFECFSGIEIPLTAKKKAVEF